MPLRIVATTVFLGLLASGPAAAQSAASRIDQPTAGTLPPGISTVPDGTSGNGDGKGGRVAPPSAIRSSTDVMEPGGSVQGRESSGRTDPIKHLPKDMR